MAAGTDGALPRFACPDWWDRMKRGDVPMVDVALNPAKAAKALALFNRLRLPDVPGNPALATACGGWFKEVMLALLCSEDLETQLPTVWEVLCMVPKKNSKTTYTAALALTALYLEEAPNRQMLLVGPTKNISERSFDQAQAMIRLDPMLLATFHVQDHIKRITRRKTGTSLDVKTFDTSIVTGEIPVLTIIEEVHELGKQASAAKVMQQIRGGGITKTRGRLMMITTQSDDAPAGIWRTELDKARAIRDGKAGPSPIMLPVLYEYPPELQKAEDYWEDQRHWRVVLPNWGLSIDPTALADDWVNNGKITRSAKQIWASQHLNIEIGVGLAAGWLGARYWDAASDPSLTLETLIARCDVACIGVDGGGLDDLFALAVVGVERGTGTWLTWGKAWVHRDVLEDRKEIAPRLLQFAEAGELEIIDEVGQDSDGVAEIAARLIAANLLPEEDAIGTDVTNLAAIRAALKAVGVTFEQLVVIPQDYRLADAIWGTERALKEKRLRHAGQGLTAWAVGNAKPETRGSAIRITKEVAGKAKIDPVMALMDAVKLIMREPVAAGSGSYLEADDEELLVL